MNRLHEPVPNEKLVISRRGLILGDDRTLSLVCRVKIFAATDSSEIVEINVPI